MKRILSEIQSGQFTREWMVENQVGQTSFKTVRRLQAGHGIEEVGEKLRGMMPWIAENAMVDKSKN
jgi:ketol-acid reductoisomerase